MKILISSAVFILMLSIGMSLRWSELVANWRRLTAADWIRLFVATFVIPPVIVLALGRILPISLAAMGGLFLIAAAPGAPLLIRNVGKRGFDIQAAASYQVWGALMIPIMVPLLVAGAAKFYGRDIWIPPLTILAMIFKQVFLPLIAGLALVQLAPKLSGRLQRPFALLANVMFVLALTALLLLLAPALKQTTFWLLVAVLVLAIGCMLAVYLLLGRKTAGIRTFAISNMNRNAGLALLLSGPFFRNGDAALPAIACYALAAPVLMLVSARIFGGRDQLPGGGVVASESATLYI